MDNNNNNNSKANDNGDARKVRKIIFDIIGELDFISKTSWRISEVTKKYDTYSDDTEELLDMFQEFCDIRVSFLDEVYSNKSLMGDLRRYRLIEEEKASE